MLSYPDDEVGNPLISIDDVENASVNSYLSDLTSSSGDKRTPIVYIQGYFDNYTDK